MDLCNEHGRRARLVVLGAQRLLAGGAYRGGLPGRVQLGDVVITGSGKVAIPFDDPNAGPGSSGTLSLAPRSKVTIDVGPYRPKERRRPTRIRVEQGAVRFARPHDVRNPRVELSTPGDVAIFGLVGTDAVLVLTDKGWAVGLLDVMGDVAIQGTHVKVLVPLVSHLIAADGTCLGRYSIDEANFQRTLKMVALAR